MLAALATRTRRRVETEVVVEKNMMFVGWCSAEAVKDVAVLQDKDQKRLFKFM